MPLKGALKAPEYLQGNTWLTVEVPLEKSSPDTWLIEATISGQQKVKPMPNSYIGIKNIQAYAGFFPDCALLDCSRI